MVETYKDLKSCRTSPGFEQLQLTPADVEDIERLLIIAEGAFSKDRYHLDPGLPNDQASYRYEYWIDNGVKSGDAFFVYQGAVSGKLLGFCHLGEVSATKGDISLVAIESNPSNAPVSRTGHYDV